MRERLYSCNTLSPSLTEVILPSTYKNRVRGLCGNYDGSSKNEYMKPDGTVTRKLDEFGESWRVTDRQGAELVTADLPKMVHLHRWEGITRLYINTFHVFIYLLVHS